MLPLLAPMLLLASLLQALEPQFAAELLTVPGPDGAPVPVLTTCGTRDKDYIVEVNGGGLVLGDFDGDGALDLVVVSGSTLARVEAGEPGDPPRFLRNDGEGRFTEPGGAWALAGGRWGMGGTAGDVDADGHLDLVVTEWGPDRLFENADGKGFVERTAGSGLSGARWSTSAAFLDAEADGHLDLVVVSYLAFRPEDVASRTSGQCKWKGHPVMCGPEGLNPVHDVLYRGAGDFTFTDVTLEAGFRPAAAGFGLGVTTLDYDGDGDTDVYVTNDSTPNHLWRNDGGRFTEVGLQAGVALDRNGKEQAGMGIGVGDLDGDGVQDLFVTNFSGESNACYLSKRRREGAPQMFGEAADRAGLMGPSIAALGWGTAAGDLDLDGDLDLFVLNGHVYPQADRPGTDTRYAQEADLYRNTGGGRFARTPLSGLGPRVLR
ncbi:MAG TPA: VCBS repeat-containing protein, partial [Planctomycetota bacterium]|nr:VCBS repeat-containing protein [Planctomycetota bacterium]